MAQKQEQQVQKGKYGIDLDEQALSLLKEVEGDPTLEDCVCRDIWELQQAKKLQQNFQKHAIDKQKESINFNSIPKTVSDLNQEDDLELELLRQRRIQQLQSSFEKQNPEFEVVLEPQNLIRLIKCTEKLIIVSVQNLQDSNGHNKISIQQFSKVIAQIAEPIKNLVIVHTTLTVLRSVIKQQSAQKQLSYDQDQIVCFLNGSLKSRILINFVELNCLEISNQLSLIYGFEDEGNLSDTSEDEWRSPCTQCGRNFPHEHIKNYRVED
eukprot:TRINITY_DN24576_c0_g1_i1.p1 TRINITY_DN24576_c0_g1~~TRINITY_DN24576_c0_g1_i1.p1  ORF type:complete len:267 (-),score=28.73 TRINITY_DN24576_c0_g1_i1:110-910(-)